MTEYPPCDDGQKVSSRFCKDSECEFEMSDHRHMAVMCYVVENWQGLSRIIWEDDAAERSAGPDVARLRKKIGVVTDVDIDDVDMGWTVCAGHTHLFRPNLIFQL